MSLISKTKYAIGEKYQLRLLTFLSRRHWWKRIGTAWRACRCRGFYNALHCNQSQVLFSINQLYQILFTEKSQKFLVIPLVDIHVYRSEEALVYCVIRKEDLMVHSIYGTWLCIIDIDERWNDWCSITHYTISVKIDIIINNMMNKVRNVSYKTSLKMILMINMIWNTEAETTENKSHTTLNKSFM